MGLLMQSPNLTYLSKLTNHWSRELRPKSLTLSQFAEDLQESQSKKSPSPTLRHIQSLIILIGLNGPMVI
jgi:hypothetical protein